MSQDAQTGTLKVNDAGHVVITPDKPARTKLENEIDIIRRTLFNVLDRLERLKQDKLTTT